MVSLLLLSSRLFRRISYELFLRCHQGLAFVMAYASWRHVPSSSKVLRAYLLASGGTFLITLILQCFAILYRNFSLHRGPPWLLQSIDCETKWRGENDNIPPSAVENQSQTTCQCLDPIHQPVFLPAEPPLHRCVLGRGRKH